MKHKRIITSVSSRVEVEHKTSKNKKPFRLNRTTTNTQHPGGAAAEDFTRSAASHLNGVPVGGDVAQWQDGWRQTSAVGSLTTVAQSSGLGAMIYGSTHDRKRLTPFRTSA
ncbi:hypothetical protein EYF80_065461 [Liparis tanakae]|uniref:Uncharacterized protein n=1 Tax=Liparis tanakae TaxID=230148 RepID=A0A4Z2E777_9TELE|nr:hypothetical protein EYF80_065461 [Liparis tanakae]